MNIVACFLLLYAVCVTGFCYAAEECQPCDIVVKQGVGSRLLAVPQVGAFESSSTGPENIVWARYYKSYEETGWDRLEISVIAAVPLSNSIKARAAGYAEGHFQADRIYDYYTNYRKNEFKNADNQPTQDLIDWLTQQDQFVRRNIQLYAEAPEALHLQSVKDANEHATWALSSSTHPSHLEQLQRSSSNGSSSRNESSNDVQNGTDSSSNSTDEQQYWRLMGLVMAQFDGFCEGFWDAAPEDRNLTYHELYLLQSVGDFYDLKVIFPQTNATQPKDAGRQLGQTFPTRDYQPGHGSVGPGGYGGGELLECSALIKLGESETQQQQQQQGRKMLGTYTASSQQQQQRRHRRELQASKPEGAERQGMDRGRMRAPVSTAPADFWAGHATWRPYYAMLRTWKVYELPWSRTGPVTVSSSPGFVGYSKDDWYTTDRFVIMETTNGVYNKTLYEAIHHDCALMWQRVQVANLGAASGKEWASLFSRYNSGTYNNQWMVLDVHRLMKGHKKNVLWVLEQVPGTIEAADVSAVLLQQGYWASYNVPYFERIYNMSGYPVDGDLHSTCPRAKLFAREQQSVESLGDMMRLMRLNRYQDDPVSSGNPMNAIASRYDLEPLPGTVSNWTRRAYGAVDAKVVDWRSFDQQRTHMVNGPTDDDQPSFSWSCYCDEDNASNASKQDRCSNTTGQQQQTMRQRQPPATHMTPGWAGRRQVLGQKPNLSSDITGNISGAAAAEAVNHAEAAPGQGWLHAGGAAVGVTGVDVGEVKSCGISHEGLVDVFDLPWQQMQASFPWSGRRRR